MLTGTQIGPFTIEKELGSGAMGSVYRARYEKTGKRVAIKIIAPGLAGSPKSMERFEREANILKQLSHPNIVRLYAVGKFQGTPYYAMEYVDGESLDHVMARRGRISWEEVVAMGQHLCSALQHAHEKGIIHRDLKPSNLMVLRDGTIKLADFGIAKDLDVTQLTSANCTVGTASYMSPEQCKGERDLTHKSDLYSLGVVFYELVTGRKPFISETPMDMFLMHVQGAFERPARLVLDIPVWLDNLICQLLEKKPDHRPLDAARVSEALVRIQEKVEAQKSAGVDIVQTQLKDRAKTDLELDVRDKEAARSILGKKRKAKRKGRGVPLYQRIWLQAVVLSAVLVGLGYLVFGVLLKPATPEELLSQTEALMAHEEWSEALDGPIKEYLAKYGDRDDNTSREMHKHADEADWRELLRKLNAWNNLRRPIDTAPEEAARNALKLEESDPEKAWPLWRGLLDQKENTNRKERAWGLLAEQRMASIQEKVLDSIQKRLKKADDLAVKKPDEAKPIYQDIVDHYGRDGGSVHAWGPDFRQLVKRAQEGKDKIK